MFFVVLFLIDFLHLQAVKQKVLMYTMVLPLIHLFLDKYVTTLMQSQCLNHLQTV